MTENMRYVDESKMARNTSKPTSRTQKAYAYPSVTLNESSTEIPVTWTENQGLLYTYSAATLGVNDNVSAEQGNSPHTRVQGICPSGWHIPSDMEWNDLEAAIQNDMGSYSKASSNIKWNSNWNTAQLQGNNLAAAMVAQCNVSGVTIAHIGKGYSAYQGGFNVLLTGTSYYVYSGAYGEESDIWASSTSGSEAAYRRSFNHLLLTVNRTGQSRTYLFGVRCKQD